MKRGQFLPACPASPNHPPAIPVRPATPAISVRPATPARSGRALQHCWPRHCRRASQMRPAMPRNWRQACRRRHLRPLPRLLSLHLCRLPRHRRARHRPLSTLPWRRRWHPVRPETCPAPSLPLYLRSRRRPAMPAQTPRTTQRAMPKPRPTATKRRLLAHCCPRLLLPCLCHHSPSRRYPWAISQPRRCRHPPRPSAKPALAVSRTALLVCWHRRLPGLIARSALSRPSCRRSKQRRCQQAIARRCQQPR